MKWKTSLGKTLPPSLRNISLAKVFSFTISLHWPYSTLDSQEQIWFVSWAVKNFFLFSLAEWLYKYCHHDITYSFRSIPHLVADCLPFIFVFLLTTWISSIQMISLSLMTASWNNFHRKKYRRFQIDIFLYEFYFGKSFVGKLLFVLFNKLRVNNY